MKPPIADPFEPTLSDAPQWRIFRLHFGRFLALLLTGSFFGSMPVVWLLLAHQRPSVRHHAVDVGFGAGFVASLFLSAVIVYFLPTRINSQKLKSTNSYGGEIEVEWSQIRSVRFFWLLLPYAVVSTSTRRNSIWLPLIFSDMKGFARAVEELAPEDNPLRRFLTAKFPP